MQSEIKANIHALKMTRPLEYMYVGTSCPADYSEWRGERPLDPDTYKLQVDSGPAGGVISAHSHHCFAGRDFRNNIKYGEDIRLFV